MLYSGAPLSDSVLSGAIENGRLLSIIIIDIANAIANAFIIDIVNELTIAITFDVNSHPASNTHDWSPYTKRNRTYLLLSPNNTGPRRDLRADKVAFWNRLVPHLVDSLAVNATPVATPVATQQLLKPTVKMWVLLASIGVLFVVVLLLTALMVRLTMENRRFKRTSSNAYITKHQL